MLSNRPFGPINCVSGPKPSKLDPFLAKTLNSSFKCSKIKVSSSLWLSLCILLIVFESQSKEENANKELSKSLSSLQVSTLPNSKENTITFEHPEIKNFCQDDQSCREYAYLHCPSKNAKKSHCLEEYKNSWITICICISK